MYPISISKLSVLTAVLLSLTAPMASANLLTNGDFSGNVAGSPNATGWTFSGGNGSQGVYNDSFSLPGGGNYYWLNGNVNQEPTLTQTVAVTPGTLYSVSGFYSTRVAGQSTNSFAVRLTDANSNTVLSTRTFNPTSVGSQFGGASVWEEFGFTESFATNSVRVVLIGQFNGRDDDFSVDNVSLVAVAVPETGTLILGLVGGIGGVAVFLRRRKT